ncbi:MAG: hypothetical protein DRI77_00095 [Chloroflexi bacterium]|nr:MAG: hypothetical protein DRI77_00095 [Chloroflexota bacterium]
MGKEELSRCTNSRWRGPGRLPRQRNSHPRPNWLKTNGLLVFGALVFVIGGWWVFIREPAPPAVQSVPAPTAIPAPAIEEPAGFFDDSGAESGFFPTTEPTPVPPTVTPPPPTATPEGLLYNVFVDGQSIICLCTEAGAIIGDAVCFDAAPSACGENVDGQ